MKLQGTRDEGHPSPTTWSFAVTRRRPVESMRAGDVLESEDVLESGDV